MRKDIQFILESSFSKLILWILIFMGSQSINANFLYNRNLTLINAVSIISLGIRYLYLCYKDRNLDRKANKNKFILSLREFFKIIVYTCMGQIVYSYGQNLNIFWLEYVGLFFKSVVLKNVLSMEAILLDVQMGKLVKVLVIGSFSIILLGGFDMSWWVLITGTIALFNYINSKDFIIFLRIGKSIDKVPETLENIWQRNKFIVYFSAVILYLSLLIASFKEKNMDMSILDKAQHRLTILSIVLLIFMLIILFVLVLLKTSKNKFLLPIKYFLKIEKLEQYILLNRIAQIKRCKKRRRRTR